MFNNTKNPLNLTFSMTHQLPERYQLKQKIAYDIGSLNEMKWDAMKIGSLAGGNKRFGRLKNFPNVYLAGKRFGGWVLKLY